MMSEELESGVLLLEPYVDVGLLYAGLYWLGALKEFCCCLMAECAASAHFA